MESLSLCALTLYLNVLRTLSRVRVDIRIFQVTPQQGTGPVPGGIGPARYMNQSDSHPKTVTKIFQPQRISRFHRFTGRFFSSWEPALVPTVWGTLVQDRVTWARACPPALTMSAVVETRDREFGRL
jgi:hypothetical protein